MNSPEKWIAEEIPELRIIPDGLWQRVKAQQSATRSDVICEGVRRSERARRPKHLLSGLLTCGQCGGGFTVVGKAYYGCANARNKGTCSNRLTITKSTVECRVLFGLKDQLLDPNLISEFARAYQEEYNRLAGTTRTDRAKAERELAKVIRQIDKIIEAIAEGMFHPSMKVKMDKLEDQKAGLEAELASALEPSPILLHPGLSDVYRRKVANLVNALNTPETKVEAGNVIRNMLSEIRLTPENGTLAIDLFGELAGLLALDANKSARSVSTTGRSVTLVAGVGFEPTTFRL